MVSEGKLANAFCGKSARACDNCIKKRARWYCAADDAFLCQSCDSSVHSANTLARRHERVRLKIASLKSFDGNSKPKLHVLTTTWHKGFTRKARTPRQNKKISKFSSHHEPVRGIVVDDGNNNNGNNISNPLHLVPEMENSNEDNDEQLLYRVPIFEPFVSELCNSNEPVSTIQDENKGHVVSNDHNLCEGMTHLQGFLPSEMDLAEFAADVESLLGKGLEDESFDMKELGLSDSKECLGLVKVEDEEVITNNRHQGDYHDHHDQMFDVERETFELNFDYDSPITTTAVDDEEEAEEGNKERILEPIVMINNKNNNGFDLHKMILSLDYEGVMSAWDEHKSPWTTRERPNFDSDGCWPHCMGACGTMHLYGDMSVMSSAHAVAMADGGRQARVSRYREKRRTRLFSKKIRYEVRKLNAEKRPRMKGRFVKRSSNLFT